ncbi:MAG: 2-oxoacid:acceptor oxidoreductase family protein [Oscillospiraceae bacterium]|nr:2-oxoacid:acceptor oxidoreductase family protein [Oscillospiraceae bacterium]
MNAKMLIAGFGGQGVLFAGKFLVFAGMLIGKDISWLPAYGPEMRGGTANCSVILSDESIGSPIVDKPDILIALNLPSLDKFEDMVVSDGHIFINSSLINRLSHRIDAVSYYCPATRIADENGLPGLANMVMLGHVVAHYNLYPMEVLAESMKKLITGRKKEMYDKNMEALKLGMKYQPL